MVQVLPVVFNVLVPVGARHHELAVESHQRLHELLMSTGQHWEPLLWREQQAGWSGSNIAQYLPRVLNKSNSCEQRIK